MKIGNTRLRMVTLDSFYDCFQAPGVCEFITSLFKLRLRGYRPHYPTGMLPLDTTEFISTQFALCEETAEGALRPLTCFKYVSFKKCRSHFLGFPLLPSIPGEYPRIKERVQSILDSADQAGRDVFYGSAWTIEPELRAGNPELLAFTKHSFVSMSILGYLEFMKGGEILYAALEKFKVPAFVEKELGFSTILPQDGASTYPHIFTGGLDVRVEHSSGLESRISQVDLFSRRLWEERIHFSVKPGERKSAA